MVGSAAGSASSMAWTVVNSTESESWSDIGAAQAKDSDTDGPNIVTSLDPDLASFDLVEDVDAMTLPAMAQEPTSQPSSKVTDWVEQQALEDRAPDTSGAPTLGGMTIKPSSTAILGSRRYDIVTMLQIRYTSNLANVELRIHPSALQEQIFKSTPSISFTRTQRRSRGLSDLSLNSLRSIAYEEEVTHHKSRPARQPIAPPLNFNEALQLNFVNRFPRRQPCSPPSSSLAQQHDGFARFLKEHASPPHQRVTAGGRIVPAAGPPPIFNVESLRVPTSGSGTQEPSATLQELRKGSAAEEGFRHTAAAAANNALSNGHENIPLGNHHSSRAQQAIVSIQADGSKGNQTNGQLQLQVGTAPHVPSGSNPFVLADGSNVVIQNGYPYRVYWNGFQTVSEPMIIPFAAVPGSMHTNLQSAGVAPQYSIANPYANTAIVPLTLFNTANGQDARPPQSDQQLPDHALERLQETFRYELKKLDKHIALRSHMFSTLEHNSYVAQRKHLVEQMDNIRISRRSGSRSSSNTMATTQGYLNSTLIASTHGYNVNHRASMQVDPTSQDPRVIGIPAKFDAQGIVTGPPWNALVNGVSKAASATAPIAEPQQKTPPPKKGLGASSILSPDAPPFIPSSMKKSTARKVETCILNDQRQNDSANMNLPSSVMAPRMSYGDHLVVTKTQKAIAIPSADKESQTTFQGSSKALWPHGRSRMSGSGSAMYDLVPLVHQADIAYVENLSLNPMQDFKLYCSTTTEFQEVIRRVREQARLYGCEGGQSKDPEYDAEQDIRWAMADRSPIPLPKKLPDHIVNPRPWNWNDSAFNIRADRSHLRSTTLTAPATHVGKAQPQTEVLEAGTYNNETVHGQLAQETDFRTIAKVGSSPITHASPESNANTGPKYVASESKKLEPSTFPRTILGDLSPNKQAAAAISENGNGQSNVDAAEPAPGTALVDDPMFWHKVIQAKLAGWENEGPVPYLQDKKEDNKLSKRYVHRADIDNETESRSGTVIPMYVKDDATAVSGPDKIRSTLAGAQLGIQKESAEQWTKEHQDAVDAACLHNPYERPPTPEGWRVPPLPPDIWSKMPFKLEDWPKAPHKNPQVHFPDGQQYGPSTTEANIAMASSSDHRQLGYNEYKPISIPTGSMSAAPHSFLRDMLKTSRFSPNSLGQQKYTESMTGRKVSFGEASSMPTNKENLRSSMRSSSQASYTSNPPVGKGNAYHSSQAARLSKAQSLVAPSSQHAQGYLPQYQGLGNPQLSDYYVRYHTPQPYGKMQGGYLGSSRPDIAPYSPRRYPPQYDGGADSPPRLTKDHSDGAGEVDGTKGTELSRQAFQIDNGTLPAGHSYAVDRLFQTIREAERKEKDNYDQKASKRT